MPRLAAFRHARSWRAALALASSATLAAACADGAAPAPLEPGPTTGTASVGTPSASAASFPITGTAGIALLNQAPSDSSGGLRPIRGVAGVAVTVYAFAADSAVSALRKVGETTTGADGTFTTPALPAGRYQVMATPPSGSGLGTAFIVVTIGTSAPAPLRLYMGGDRTSAPPPRDSTPAPRPPQDTTATPQDTTPRPVRGYVGVGYSSAADSAATSRERVPNVTLVLYAITPGDSLTGRPQGEREVSRTTSGADGSFATAAVPRGTYRLVATPPPGSAYAEASRALWVPAGGLSGVAVLLPKR